MTTVGRPSEIDGNGNVIEKKVVNVNIPVKLIKFLKEKNINRSKLFTESVRKLYQAELCPKCYGSDGIQKPVCGIRCDDCDIWIKMNNCPSCNTPYQPHYNMFNNDWDKKTDKPIYGCWECMGKPDLSRKFD